MVTSACPYLPQRRRFHFAAQVMHDVMQPIADAQHRHRPTRVRCIPPPAHPRHKRRRAARENHADGFNALNFARAPCTAQHDGKTFTRVCAAQSAADDGLRTKDREYDCLGVHSLVWQGRGGDVKIGKHVEILPCCLNLVVHRSPSCTPPLFARSMRRRPTHLPHPIREAASCRLPLPRRLAPNREVAGQRHPLLQHR